MIVCSVVTWGAYDETVWMVGSTGSSEDQLAKNPRVIVAHWHRRQ